MTKLQYQVEKIAVKKVSSSTTRKSIDGPTMKKDCTNKLTLPTPDKA